MLSKGKVVVSEKSGAPDEEARYKGVVVFSDSDNVIWVALALLRNPKLRREMEIRAVAFIAADQAGIGVRVRFGVTPSYFLVVEVCAS